ncbi:RNA polymerase sigma factor SigS [Bacillus sp. THAF10]|uniref:sigma-70 family RNA polymerase sigma factor n=1 Tax=Bacillus sp. THAF10 TaxID=2587848 RepID=UPI0012A9E1DB|nr:sigma-70 family RNA polymerase sigma factor [Bacillus sp. THAF10]QFT88544.1 RNA polymerase sigma factor SigS [Bacillus sp. THAF10]
MQAPFEEIHQQYTPMIHHIIKTLNIHSDKELYFHEASVALWEATLTFKCHKGAFSSYAYSCMRGKVLNLLKKEIKRSSTEICTLSLPEQPIFLTNAMIEINIKNLTPKQKIWVIEYVINGKKLNEIAKENEVTVSAVKSWRKEAIKKLKKEMKY